MERAGRIMGGRDAAADAVDAAVREGEAMAKEIGGIMESQGRPERTLVQDLFLIGEMNSDLFPDRDAARAGALLEEMPAEVVLYAL